jgi:threonine/homoserine/homoserine lactone efflux protein
MTDYLFYFFLVSFTMALTPGPAMMYCINTSMDHGKRAGILAAMGVELGTFIYVLITALGLATLILASPMIYSGLRILGALYLLYLAYKALPKQKVLTEKKAVRSKSSTVLAGITVNITNPKILLFFITLLPQFVPTDHRNIKIFFVLGLAFNLCGFVANSSAAIFSHRLKYKFTQSASTRASQFMQYIPSAIFFLIAALSLSLTIL